MAGGQGGHYLTLTFEREGVSLSFLALRWGGRGAVVNFFFNIFFLPYTHSFMNNDQSLLKW